MFAARTILVTQHFSTVFKMLDSRRENFRLSKAYADKVKVINVITVPEIETLGRDFYLIQS